MEQSALLQPANDCAMRIMVLEMTVAAVAAQLPKDDLDEIASLFVLISKGSEEACDLFNIPVHELDLVRASHDAVALLERVAVSRKPDRDGKISRPDRSR